MKCTWIVAAATFVIGVNASPAQENVDKAKAAVFDGRMFGGPLNPKSYPCFVRRYDANHLAQHPKQKVCAMKLLVAAEAAEDDASDDLIAGADDKIFRVDRASLHECSELVTDRKELAALRRN